MSVLELKERVRSILTDMLGLIEIDQDGDFRISIDSAAVFVRVVELEDLNVIHIFSQVLTEVPLSGELYRWVATEGQQFLFCNASVREVDDHTGVVEFQYNILGDYLDAEELRMAVRAVVSVAEEKDDELQARFGGRRFFEA